MSRHYLLDGYNIIKQAPGLADLPLQEGREGLIRWINTTRPQGSLQNLVTVVFDGNPAHFGGMSCAPIKVVFSDHQSADDFIKAVIDGAKDKKKFVIVSDDKGITLYVRALGAGVLGVKAFAAELFPSRSPGRRAHKEKPGQPVKYISITQTQKINKEFEKIWLK